MPNLRLACPDLLLSLRHRAHEVNKSQPQLIEPFPDITIPIYHHSDIIEREEIRR
jgi:hypothetical protein